MPWVQESSVADLDAPSLQARYVTIAPMSLAGGKGHLVVIEEADMVNARRPSDQDPEVTVSRSADSNQSPESDPTPEVQENILDAVSKDLGGDGQSGIAPQLSVSKLQEKGSLAEVIMRSAGLVAIAFNDEAETVYWSEGAQALTGLGQKDVPDLKTFTEKVFPHGKERKLFKHWLDSEPEDRSQELKIRTLDSILSSVWRAGEWNDADTGELGMLWTRLDPPRILGGQKAASLDEGEPAIPSDDS